MPPSDLGKMMAAVRVSTELQHPRRWLLGQQREEDKGERVRTEAALFMDGWISSTSISANSHVQWIMCLSTLSLWDPRT